MIALTPRAGRWNHRYLVPEGNTLSQGAISGMAERAQKAPDGSDYVSVRNEVVQPTTGRTGVELVIVQDPRLASIPHRRGEATFAAVRDVLLDCQKQLDFLVTQQVDWDSLAPQLVVPRPELTAWRDRIDGILLRADDLSPPEHNHRKNSGTESVPSGWLRHLTCRRPVIIGVILVVVLLMVLILALFPGLIPRGDDGPKTGDPKRPGLPNEAGLKKLAESIHLTIGSPPGPSDWGAVADRLDELFEPVLNPVPTDTNKTPKPTCHLSGSEAGNDAARIRCNLVRLYTVSYRKPPDPDSLEHLLEDQGLLATAGKLFPGDNGDIDPYGLLAAEHKVHLQSINPVGFHKLVIPIVQLQQFERDNSPLPDSIYTDFIRTFREADFRPPLWHFYLECKRVPRFFINDDLKTTSDVKNLLNNTPISKMIGGYTRGDALSTQLGYVCKCGNDKQHALSLDRIDTLVKSHANKSTISRQYECLHQIVSGCIISCEPINK